MVRPLPMMFPEDAFVAQVTDAYMYGDHLLVAPICTDSNRRQVVFPAGRYVNFFDNTEIVDGDTAQTRDYPITEIPVYVAAGALFPVELNEVPGVWKKHDHKPDQGARPDAAGVRDGRQLERVGYGGK